MSKPDAGEGRWRLDSPISEAVAAVAALTPEQLADCSVEVRFAGDDAAPWVEVYSPRDAAAPLISLELPGDADTGNVARMVVLHALHELAALCCGEKYAA